VVSTGLSGHGSSARCTGQLGPAVTRPSTPDGAGQGAKAVVGPLLAGWAQGGAHDWPVGAAEGQGGGQAIIAWFVTVALPLPPGAVEAAQGGHAIIVVLGAAVAPPAALPGSVGYAHGPGQA